MTNETSSQSSVNQTEVTNENFQEIFSLLDFFSKTSLVELEVEKTKFKILLKKFPEKVTKLQTYDRKLAHPVLSSQEPKISTNSEKKYSQFVAPMAGTFYSAPSPNSPPFIKEGDLVKIGQGVCIIEAMKLMNEIKADRNGQIIKIFCQNGQAIEKGMLLFYIDEEA